MPVIEQMVKEALAEGGSEYVDLIEVTTGLLASTEEASEGFSVEGRLVRMRPSGETIMVGDLHGDLMSLIHILKTSGFVEKAERKSEIRAIFLGDYGDRGPFSPEVYYVVLKLKQLFPQNVVLMRGNHEGPDDLQPVPHDLPQNLLDRFGEEGREVYSKIRAMYQHLSTAVVVESSCVLVHGGIPQHAHSLEDLAYAHLVHPETTTLEEILWSDPVEDIDGTRPSPRGAGRLFGPDVSRSFLSACGAVMLIRGHEPASDGFKINHQGRVLTLFSRKGPPYFNNLAAYLQLDLSLKPQSAHTLTPYIRQF